MIYIWLVVNLDVTQILHYIKKVADATFSHVLSILIKINIIEI